VQSCGSNVSSTQPRSRPERALRRAPKAPATEQFLGTASHYLLFAYDDDADAGGGVVLAMISGVETTHPDKGTEMFLYELGVALPPGSVGLLPSSWQPLPRWPRPAGAMACGSPSTWTMWLHCLPTAARARSGLRGAVLGLDQVLTAGG